MAYIKLSEKECNKRCEEIRSVIKGACEFCGKELKQHNFGDTRGTKCGCPSDERNVEILLIITFFMLGMAVGTFINLK